RQQPLAGRVPHRAFSGAGGLRGDGQVGDVLRVRLAHVRLPASGRRGGDEVYLEVTVGDVLLQPLGDCTAKDRARHQTFLPWIRDTPTCAAFSPRVFRYSRAAGRT